MARRWTTNASTRRVLSAIACALGGWVACVAPLDAGREAAFRERGAAAVAPFKQGLLAELTSALGRAGPESAIEVCRLRAPELARAASSAAARVGRTSHKLRNPANAAPRWAAPLLAAYVASPAGSAPRVVALPGGRAGYVEPIFTGPLCLACHGDAIAPSVAAQLRALYPQDRAVGFRLGELRGVFWVELAAQTRP